MTHVFLPPATIGILGGGQLGRMMALEARAMGYKIVTLDPTENSPCGQVADKQIVAAFDSLQGASDLAKYADVLTYEFENIGANIADDLVKNSTLPQGYDLLYTTQNRLREKQAIEQAGVQVAPYRHITHGHELSAAIKQLGYPSVLKTTEGGYDGKGQWVLKTHEHVQEVEQELHKIEEQRTQAGLTKIEWVLEQWIPFTQEISCIVARNSKGETRPFPVAENIHLDNILHVSIAPARVSQDIQNKATQLAQKLADSFDLVGLLAIEIFVLEDGTLYVNELAPRPHNSGHYTQQACQTSQFEQHIRAVCNLPLGNIAIMQPTVMVNILGEQLQEVVDKLPQLDQDFKLHLYGKKEAKPKRKMGHLNVVSPTIEQSLDKIKALKIWNMEGIL